MSKVEQHAPRRVALLNEALSLSDAAILLAEQMERSVVAIEYRSRLAQSFDTCYRTAVISCTETRRLCEALKYLERSRAKILADSVNSLLPVTAADVGEERYATYTRLRGQLTTQAYSVAGHSEPGATSQPGQRSEANAMAARRDLDALLKQIAEERPDTPFGRRWRAGQIHYLRDEGQYLALPQDRRSAVLSLSTWSDDGRLRGFLITSKRGLELLTFPERSADTLEAIAHHWSKVYTLGSEEQSAALVLEVSSLLYQEVFATDVEVRGEGRSNAHEEVPLRAYLDEVLELGSVEHPRTLVLIPHRHLFLLPFHSACWSTASGRRNSEALPEATDLHYLLDEYEIRYAPSAYLWSTSQDRLREGRKDTRRRALVVGNPLPAEPLPPLPGAAEEAHAASALLKHFGWSVDGLFHQAATKHNFLYGGEGVRGIMSGGYDHLHLAQHAQIRDGGEISLIFSRQPSIDDRARRCTIGEIAASPLQGVGCVVAATCLSSHADPHGSEYLGLAAGFMHAGVGTYIGAHYTLSDIGSKEVMDRMYKARFQKEISWGASLREAQLALAHPVERLNRPGANAERGATMNAEDLKRLDKQDLTGLKHVVPLWHPYHWAAMSAMGSG